MNTNNQRPDPREDAAKREILKKPGKDDVHEQREPGQKQAGAVRQPERDGNEPPHRDTK